MAQDPGNTVIMDMDQDCTEVCKIMQMQEYKIVVLL
jgi:hypothetical protein